MMKSWNVERHAHWAALKWLSHKSVLGVGKLILFHKSIL